MSIPISTEKVARAVIKALVQGGYLASTADAEALYAIPANATEIDINTVVGSLTYPGGGGGPVTDYTSDTDINMWIDADGLPNSPRHWDYFRVCRVGASAANIAKNTELFSVRYNGGFTMATPYIYATIGPNLLLAGGFATNDAFGAVLNIGTYCTGTPTGIHYGVIEGNSTALQGTLPGLSVTTTKSLELYVNDDFGLRPSSGGALRGGFHNLTSGADFFVGDYSGSTGTHALHITDITAGNFEIKLNDTHSFRSLYFNSVDTSSHSLMVSIGGWSTVAGRESNYLGINTLSVYGPTLGGNSVAIFENKQAGAYVSDVVRILSYDATAASHNLLVCEQWNAGAGAYVHRFRVKCDGNVYGTAFNVGGADLAEWMPTASIYAPGTVVILRNGVVVASDEYEATGAVGVVSHQPGLIMNGQYADEAGYLRIARTGVVPTFFSTEFGDVCGNGELVCTGPDGYAVRAPSRPLPGSVVGKALGKLVSLDGEIVKGVIDVMVGT